MAMKVTILAFGIVREITGSPTIAIELPDGATVAVLAERLKQQYPGLIRLRSFAITVNGAYAAQASIIDPGDEVAIIPPVSGG